jgi:hypothetical protein
VKAKYFLKEIKKWQQLIKADDVTEMDDINTEMQMNMVTTHIVELFALYMFLEPFIIIVNTDSHLSLFRS